MAAGISHEARMRRARRIAERFRALARAAGWRVTPPARGQATTATVTAPDGRTLYLRTSWSSASNGETFGRLAWQAEYPGELEAGRRFRDVPSWSGALPDTGGAPGMVEGAALSAYVLGHRPRADGFVLAALRVLDALQPRPEPDDTGAPANWYAVRSDTRGGAWAVYACVPDLPGVVGSAYRHPAELVRYVYPGDADMPAQALRIAAATQPEEA